MSLQGKIRILQDYICEIYQLLSDEERNILTRIEEDDDQETKRKFWFYDFYYCVKFGKIREDGGVSRGPRLILQRITSQTYVPIAYYKRYEYPEYRRDIKRVREERQDDDNFVCPWDHWNCYYQGVYGDDEQVEPPIPTVN